VAIKDYPQVKKMSSGRTKTGQAKPALQIPRKRRGNKATENLALSLKQKA